jgi:hypothetical protein
VLYSHPPIAMISCHAVSFIYVVPARRYCSVYSVEVVCVQGCFVAGQWSSYVQDCFIARQWSSVYWVISLLGSGRLCTGLFRRKVVVICVLGYFVARQWSSVYRVISSQGSGHLCTGLFRC